MARMLVVSPGTDHRVIPEALVAQLAGHRGSKHGVVEAPTSERNGCCSVAAQVQSVEYLGADAVLRCSVGAETPTARTPGAFDAACGTAATSNSPAGRRPPSQVLPALRRAQSEPGPQPGFTPHPLTLSAAQEMLDLVDRSGRFRSTPPF